MIECLVESFIKQIVEENFCSDRWLVALIINYLEFRELKLFVRGSVAKRTNRRNRHSYQYAISVIESQLIPQACHFAEEKTVVEFLSHTVTFVNPNFELICQSDSGNNVIYFEKNLSFTKEKKNNCTIQEVDDDDNCGVTCRLKTRCEQVAQGFKIHFCGVILPSWLVSSLYA